MMKSPIRVAPLILLGACGDAGPDAGPELGAPAPVEPVASPAPRGSAEPHLFAGAEGRVYLSWLEAVGDTADALRFAVLDDGAWSAPKTITRGADLIVNWADFPSLIALPAGRLAAHWLRREGEGTYHYGVRIAQSTDGGETWSRPVTPHRDGALAEHGFVSLWAGAGDSLAAVWLDGRQYAEPYGGTKEMSLAFTTVAPDGSLGAERILDGRTCECCQTAAAMTSRGPIVVYRDRSPEEIRDIYVTRRLNGEWTEPKPVYRDGWVMPACPVNGPAVDADGELVAVAWFTAANDTARVRLAFSGDAGETFSDPVRVDGGNPAGRVDVVLLEDGGALVSWIERTGGGGAEVRARRVSPDGILSAPITVASSSAARASGFPQMVRAGDQVVFAWTEPGDPSRVRVARLPLGLPLGEES